MVIEILRANLRATMCIGIIALAEDMCAGNVCGEKISQPVDTGIMSPRFFALCIESMNSDNARK